MNNYNNYHSSFEQQNNWQFSSNVAQNFPTNPNLKSVPLYLTSSDPRFKQSGSAYDPLSIIVPKVENLKNEDELWVETFLTNIGKINRNEEPKPKKTSRIITKQPLKVHTAKNTLHKCINLLKNLETLENYLRENVSTITTAEWKEKTVEIGLQKEEFTNLLSQFDNPTLESLKFTLNQRQKKRQRLRMKKKGLQTEYKAYLKKREIIKKNIDSWLEKMKTDVEKAKQDELLKKDADCILSEVTKKKSDARKQLALLAALVKLRSVREKTAEVNGKKLNLDDSSAFVKNTEMLRNMWENALQTYSKEEQSLKVMLENNAANEVHTAISKEKKIINDWETVLFGPKIIPSDAYWALTCAEKDIRTFIAIRKSWDTFLVPEENQEGSRIPIGWVLPKLENWLPKT